MIIKGGAAGNAGWWTKHLLRDDTNARAELKEVSGLLAEDLPTALREMAAIAAQSRSHGNFLYQANINPRDNERLTEAEWREAVDTLEKNMGLEGHQRVVVEHEKEGRVHRHVVWNRVDVDTLRVTDITNDYRAHDATARTLETRFDLARTKSAFAARQPEERNEQRELWELRAAERSGIDPNAIKAELTELWHSTDGGKAFVAAVEERGYILALGDRRTFCIVDHAGDAHSLARRLDGVKTKEVAAHLADIDRDRLPSVDEARATQRGRHSNGKAFDHAAAERAWLKRKGATATPAPESVRAPEPTRADDRRKKPKEPTRRKEEARPRSERERKEPARDSVTATPAYEVKPAHAPEPTRPDERHKQAEEQARRQEEARRQSEHLAQISASATAIYSAKPLRPEDRQRQAQEQARQQQEEARRRSERERQEHARDRVTATPTPATEPARVAQTQPSDQARQAQEQARQQEEARRRSEREREERARDRVTATPVPATEPARAAQTQPSDQARQAQEQARRQEEAQRQSARQREEMARSRAGATPHLAPESPRIEPQRVAEPKQNAPQFDPVAAQRAKEAADQKAWSAKRDAELARVTKEKETRPVKAGLRVANVAGGVGLGLVDFVSNFLTGGNRPPAATDQVGKMKERNRAVAALERIADSVARGEDLSPADVRNLTPENLHNIRLKGDDYMKWIIEGIERDREREKDGGRYRDR